MQWSTTSTRPLPLPSHIYQLVERIGNTMGLKRFKVRTPLLEIKKKLLIILTNSTTKLRGRKPNKFIKYLVIIRRHHKTRSNSMNNKSSGKV